jgi:hypothetical protein
MSTDYRALCAELLAALEIQLDELRFNNRLCVRARAALAQPEPVVATDEEILASVRHFYGDQTAADMGAEDDLRTIRAVLARWGTPTIHPVPVAERLPRPEDCLPSANDNWCWGQERSFLSGQAAARWRMMRVSSLEDEAVAWLPHWALPTPEANP